MDGSYKEKIIMKRILQHIKELLLLAGLVAAIFVALSLRPQRSAPGSSAQSLEERLAQLGVPVKSIVVTQGSPLQLQITIEHANQGSNSSHDGLWYELLTARECDMAYLNLGMRVDSCRLIEVTPEGKVVSDFKTFLHPEDLSQGLTPPPPSTVKDSEARQIFERNFDFQGLKLLTLDVPSSYTDPYNSKAVIMQLSTGKPAGDTNMAPIDQLIMSLRPQIEKINDRYGTRFILIRVKIVDSANELLVDHVEDLELWGRGSWLAKGLQAGWISAPIERGAGELPTPAPLPSLIPSVTAGAQSTPTPAPYPTP
jgi:hypothetical protein